jgi:hypothetical protein
MTHPSKVKGSRWEAVVRDYLAESLGVRVERIPAGAGADRGDLTGIDGICVECKDQQKLELAGWVVEAEREASNVSADTLPVVIAKRRMRPVEDAYAIMPLWAWTELIARSKAIK